MDKTGNQLSNTGELADKDADRHYGTMTNQVVIKEKASEAEYEARMQSLQEERARLEQEIRAREESIARYKQILAARESTNDNLIAKEEADSVAIDHEASSANTTPATPEVVEQVTKQAKSNLSFKRLIASIAATLAATAAIGLAGSAISKNSTKNDQAPNVPTANETESEINNVDDIETAAAGVAIDIPEVIETEKGITEGYNKYGMWSSPTKSSDVAFASAGEVAELFGDDDVEMVKYTARNQVESFADYLANLPEHLQPDDFKGLSILDTEAKLESLSDDAYDQILNQFNRTMDNAFTRRVVLDGEYENAYMRLRDGVDIPTHSNMELVECAKTENGIEVTEFYWLDENGNEIGNMIIKIIHNPDGTIEGCMQVVNEVNSKPHIYTHLEKIRDPEPTNNFDTTPKDTTPKDTTPEDTNPKDNTPEDTTPENVTPKDTTPEDTTPEDTTPQDTTPEDTTPKDEQITPKDAENLERIDEAIEADIATDIGTDEVENYVNPGVTAEEKTAEPETSDYEGTEATIVQNEQSESAEPVQPTQSENNYSEDRGAAHADEYAPVQEDQQGQQQADEAEVPIEQAPTGGESLNDALGDLGIS